MKDQKHYSPSCSKRQNLFFLTFTFLICAALFYIFFNMAAPPQKGSFSSDLPAHIQFAKSFFENPVVTYPVFHFSFLALNAIPFVSDSVAAATVLTGFTLLSVLYTRWLFRKFALEYISGYLLDFLAIAANIMLTFYLPMKGKHLFLGQSAPNIWHNPTYIVMKPFALVLFFLFLSMYEQHQKDGKLATKSTLFAFPLLLLLSAFAKPSFVFVFVPAIALFLLLRLMGEKFKGILFALVMGAGCLPTMLCLLLQSRISFSDQDAGIVFGISKSWTAASPNIFVSILQALIFPIMVTILCRKDFFKNNALCLSWIMMFVAGFQALLLCETGRRALHGNFFWGYAIAMACLYLVCILNLVKHIRGNKLLVGISALLFLYQSTCGVVYLVRLLCGMKYH